MKIEYSEHLAKLQQHNKNKASGTSENSNDEFSKILTGLDKKPDNAEHAKNNAQVGIGLENSALAGRILTNLSVECNNLEPKQQLEEAFDQMERYAAALGNGIKTLKEIEPLADAMQKTAGNLSRLSQSMAPENPLKSITNETAVLATVEAMKFKRGDYI